MLDHRASSANGDQRSAISDQKSRWISQAAPTKPFFLFSETENRKLKTENCFSLRSLRHCVKLSWFFFSDAVGCKLSAVGFSIPESLVAGL